MKYLKMKLKQNSINNNIKKNKILKNILNETYFL